MTGSKWRTTEDAVAVVKSGMTVGLGCIGAEPTDLTTALWARGGELRDVTILTGMLLTGYDFLTGPNAGAFRLRTWFMPGTLLSGSARDLRADYLPLNWTQTARMLAAAHIDVAFVQVSEADAQGYHSLGIHVGQQVPMLRSAKLVVAEVNPRMPRTFGSALVHESELDILVRADHPLIPFPHRDGDDIDRQVALNAAKHVPDGATLQFGIGGIPSAMLAELQTLNRKNLTIYSQLSDPGIGLIESGACRQDGPSCIIGEILGTEDLYRWADGRKDLRMASAFETHTPNALAKVENFVSVNSVLEIDLYGQTNAETLGGRQVGSTGGSSDFAIGAMFDGNLSVIALRATTKKGASRIVKQLPPGPVTAQRTLVQVVVSEFGSADLRGKTMRERAEALAAIAHPDHREDLMRAAADF
ncbi:acetyl-CoA hydrolase/transferase family protein [Seohaeicola nanhaiensis]|uniref:Acetyl-CoA hydrolase/transferase family protein n=1 Tax=Seohaeicola nanhaiensis TaxID=1387282 RepID=A0ABV9KLX6_9RHOB